MDVWYRIYLFWFNAALQILKYETDVVLVVTGLLVLISLLPAIPAKVKKTKVVVSEKQPLNQFLINTLLIKQVWQVRYGKVQYDTIRYIPAGTFLVYNKNL